MNKKLTVKGGDGNLRFCVLSPERSYDDQLCEMMGFGENGGITVSLGMESVDIVDYFHADCIGSLPVISFKDTDLDVSLEWTEITD